MLIEDPKLEVDFVPRIGVEIGNVATFASVGGTFRIGKDLRDDFGPSRARPFVGEAQAGVALIFRGMRISYMQVLRAPEFYQQERFDQFGSVNVASRF